MTLQGRILSLAVLKLPSLPVLLRGKEWQTSIYIKQLYCIALEECCEGNLNVREKSTTGRV